jgi:glycoside hydrolase-like protein
MRRVIAPTAIAVAAVVSLQSGLTVPAAAEYVVHHGAGGRATVSSVRHVIAADARSRKRRGWTTGRAFDTCAAPPLRAMAAWRNAYGTVNINIGGVARGCAQPNLTRDWVRSVRRMGYRIIPTYVGPQAPCNDRFHHRFKAKRAAIEGRRAADDAVRSARALGIRRHAPIYFDMESYDSRKAWCRDAVLRFLHEWTRRLHRHHYRSGVYSSVASGIRDLGWSEGITKPNAIWFAHWDGAASVHGSPYIPDRWWTRHRRIKQFRGGHKEKHGGVTLYVDSNVVDGPVY